MYAIYDPILVIVELCEIHIAFSLMYRFYYQSHRISVMPQA